MVNNLGIIIEAHYSMYTRIADVWKREKVVYFVLKYVACSFGNLNEQCYQSDVMVDFEFMTVQKYITTIGYQFY